MASISSPSFRINSSDPVLKTPAEIASLISIGATTVAFDAARLLVSQNPDDAVAYLLQSISARAIGRDAVCSDLLRAGLNAAPMTQELQIFNVLHQVESGQFEADSALVEKVISSNLEVEEFLFQISQRMILGPEDVISVDFALLGSKISWSIRRTHENIRSFGALYHWMPTYHNGVRNVDAFYRDYARYAKFNDPRNDRQRSFYTQRVRVTDGMKVLDAGCGSGTLLMAFRELADIEQYGVDVSPGSRTSLPVELPKWQLLGRGLDEHPIRRLEVGPHRFHRYPRTRLQASSGDD